MTKFRKIGMAVIAMAYAICCNAQKVEYTIDPQTDRLTSLSIAGDPTGMNWLVQTDQCQYPWIDSRFEWGTVARMDGSEVQGLKVKVNRKQEANDLVETYVIQNLSKQDIDLSEVQIYTPWNDNYPDANTSLTRRCHAHVWAGDRAAYTYALRMNGEGPHLGMMLEEGSIVSYTINQRGKDKGGSNTRGIIGLVPEKFILKPGRFYLLRWRIFSHQGAEDFFQKMVDKGGVRIKADRYVAMLGDTINIQTITKAQTITEQYAVNQTGDLRIDLTYGKGKPTHIEVLGYLSIPRLIDARANFIFEHQQDKQQNSPTYGAYLPYDFTERRIINNLFEDHHRSDMNEGRERIGMGLFMAYFADYANQHPEASTTINRRFLNVSLQLHADFVHKLQNENYKTWGTIKHDDKHRLYNYPWIAHYYTQMFEVTHKRQFLVDAYRTMRAMYANGGDKFYAIGVPVRKMLSLMREYSMEAEADTLLTDFRRVADYYIQNGLDFPKLEVNYEQSIVAPCVEFLCELYLETRNDNYLVWIRSMMPALEAFNGQQPSCHLNEVAIRHWDGYWFGRPQMWGDTFPHYWSCISAQAFALYAEITGNEEYRRKAKACLLANLMNFNNQGHASCAWLYPSYVDGESAHRANPCANDQDWALVYLFLHQELLNF